MSLSRFKGTLVGALVGDCIGAPFEGKKHVKVSEIISICDKIKTNYQKKTLKGELGYTDDTAMARSVIESLKEHGKFNAEDMANRFAEEYFRDPNRGYGGNITKVFSALTEPCLKDVFQPAREQFDGTGSYGNGGAMRISPAPLFLFHENNPSALENLVTQITSLTHTHPQGIMGAVLQALAVDKCLRLSEESCLNCDKFCDDLISIMQPIEIRIQSDKQPPHKKVPPKRMLDADPTPYCAKLEKIKEFVKSEDLTAKSVKQTLGNDVSALGSVPAAVLAFLRGSTMKDFDDENSFKRVIMYSISLGGDTDTIATMAGAMAGAFFGLEAIPEEWRYVCEGAEDAESAAENFFTQKPQQNSQSGESSNHDNAHKSS